MASTFALACDALVRERDRVFLEKVAADYNLDFKELEAKYLTAAESAIKVPKKYKKREPKSVTVVTEGEAPKPKATKAKAEKQACQGTTAKKEPCKFSALKGECYCKRHLEAAAKATEAPKPKPAKAPKAPKPAKAAEPVHTHPLDQKPEGECAVCESHGNPLEAESAAQMFRAEPVGLQDRLQAIIAGAADSDAESDSESGSESESEGEGEVEYAAAPPSAGGLSEEEFESEDEQ